MLQLTTKLMNKFNYSITIYFIPGNKNYHSCRNLHSVYQTYSKKKRKTKYKGGSFICFYDQWSQFYLVVSKNKGELVLSSLEGGSFGACAFDLSYIYIYIYMVHTLNLCVHIYLLLIVISSI